MPLNVYLLTYLLVASDIAVLVLKRDVKLQPTNLLTYLLFASSSRNDSTRTTRTALPSVSGSHRVKVFRRPRDIATSCAGVEFLLDHSVGGHWATTIFCISNSNCFMSTDPPFSARKPSNRHASVSFGDCECDIEN